VNGCGVDVEGVGVGGIGGGGEGGAGAAAVTGAEAAVFLLSLREAASP
jgi:hypothetical protein